MFFLMQFRKSPSILLFSSRWSVGYITIPLTKKIKKISLGFGLVIEPLKERIKLEC